MVEVTPSLLRTEFVGRSRELAALHECLRSALDRHPRVILCSGDSGIGKTRLAEELEASARAVDVPVVWGRAVDADGAPPSWMWRQTLRALCGIVDLRAVADEERLTIDLARLAPDLFGDAGEDDNGSASIEDRLRQFDAVDRLLRRLTERRGLVVVLDDAHWADRPSQLLLHHLARTMTDQRLLLLVNFRDTDDIRNGIVAELLTEPVTRRIDLRGLAAPAVAQCLRSVSGRVVAAADVRRVHTVTGGNPFFVTEMGRLLADDLGFDESSLLLPTLRGAIDSRLRRLSPACVALLRAASVVGPEFSVAVVAGMTDIGVLEALDVLDQAVAAGLVEATSVPGEQAFAHALVRDAVEAGVGAAERVRLHRRAAESIEAVFAARIGPHLSDMARHWAVAAVEGDRAPAVQWIERAGREAMRRLAYEEGARLFRLAIDVGAGSLDDAARCRLLLALVSASHLAADLPGRLEAGLEAADVARDAGRADLVAEAALALEAVGEPGSDHATRRLCEEALRAVGEGTPALRARLLARFAEACMYLEDVDDAAPASEDGLALAERCGDPGALVAALRARQLVRSGPTGLAERASLADRMLAIGRETADPETQLWAHLWKIDAAFERGALAAVAQELAPVARLADEVRGPVARFQLLRSQAALAQAYASFDEARRLVAEAFATLAPTGHASPVHVRAGMWSMIGHHLGQCEESLAAFGFSDEVVDHMRVPTVGVISAIAAAFVLAESGRLDEAASVYRSLGPVRTWKPMPHVVLVSYAFGVGVAIALGADDDIASLRQLLAPHRGHHAVSGAGPVSYLGPVELWMGRAAGRLGLLDDAVADLEQAVKACAVAGAPAFHAEAQLELAGVLVRRSGTGDVARARLLAVESARQATRLGMAPIAARALLVTQDLDRSGSPVALTRREREVAALVAGGLTNREIAARLYLSERTAQNHVQHILTKLDLANRSQIAVWAALRNEHATE